MHAININEQRGLYVGNKCINVLSIITGYSTGVSAIEQSKGAAPHQHRPQPQNCYMHLTFL